MGKTIEEWAEDGPPAEIVFMGERVREVFAEMFDIVDALERDTEEEEEDA